MTWGGSPASISMNLTSCCLRDQLGGLVLMLLCFIFRTNPTACADTGSKPVKNASQPSHVAAADCQSLISVYRSGFIQLFKFYGPLSLATSTGHMTLNRFDHQHKGEPFRLLQRFRGTGTFLDQSSMFSSAGSHQIVLSGHSFRTNREEVSVHDIVPSRMSTHGERFNGQTDRGNNRGEFS